MSREIYEIVSRNRKQNVLEKTLFSPTKRFTVRFQIKLPVGVFDYKIYVFNKSRTKVQNQTKNEHRKNIEQLNEQNR